MPQENQRRCIVFWFAVAEAIHLARGVNRPRREPCPRGVVPGSDNDKRLERGGSLLTRTVIDLTAKITADHD